MSLPTERRTDDEIIALVGLIYSPNWSRLSQAFRIDELQIAGEEFDRLCSVAYEHAERDRR